MSEVSVIIPTYRGANRILNALDSLVHQAGDLEIICVVNGPDDGTQELLAQYRREHCELNLKVIRFHGEGAGAARNMGLNAATGNRITFLDDDDVLAPGFFAAALQYPNDAIVCMPLWDIPEGLDDPVETSLSARLKALKGERVLAREAPWLLSYNAAKIIPTSLLAGTRYRTSLRSGEDVVFYAELALTSRSRVEFIIASETGEGQNCAYMRHVRQGSLSRQNVGFEFNVEDRFEVIQELSRLNVREEDQPAILSLQHSQADFVSRYLVDHPDSRDAVILAGTQRNIPIDVWKKLNGGYPVETLVVSYCFPPFNDPSGTVAAKRLIVQGRVVDCISADMAAVRSNDESLERAVAPFLRKHYVFNGPASFSDWAVISDFGRTALRAGRRAKAYSRLYTRAMWSASHVAGALIKLYNPKIYWIAEFSDPLRTDAEGNRRRGPYKKNRTARQLARAVRQSRLSRIPLQTHFDLTEAVTCLLADQLVFTNENQLEAVVACYPNDWQRMMRTKSLISPQPTLPRGYYEIGQPMELEKPNDVVRIGYFGSFYPNRGLGLILAEAESLPCDVRDKLEFVVFTRNSPEVEKQIRSVAQSVNVRCFDYLNFLDFLSMLDQLEVLLVVDAQTTNSGTNPFLPSKFADYNGANSAIWAVVEDGSPLSKQLVQYRSFVDKGESIAEALKQIATRDWSSRA